MSKTKKSAKTEAPEFALRNMRLGINIPFQRLPLEEKNMIRIQQLREEIKGRPWQPVHEAEAWLLLACPAVHALGKKLETAGLIGRTKTVLDWRASKAALGKLLNENGFTEWTALDKYFTVNGGRANASSIARQVQGQKNDRRKVQDWYRVEAAIR